MADIRVYFGVRSPYSRLGLHVVKRGGLDVEVIPFTGPPEGTPFSDPMANKLKALYYMQDAPRMAARMGLPALPPEPFEVSYKAANKAALFAARDGFGLDFAIAISDARWGEAKDISDMGVLRACAETIGWDPVQVDAAQEEGAAAEMIAVNKALIKKDGVFGVPFAVWGKQKFWGHDRFDLLVEAVQSGG